MTYMEDLINLRHKNAFRNKNKEYYNEILSVSSLKNREITDSIDEVLKIVNKTLKNCLDLEFSVLVDYLLSKEDRICSTLDYSITIPSELCILVKEVEVNPTKTMRNITVKSPSMLNLHLKDQPDFSNLEAVLRDIAQRIINKKENKYISLYKHRIRMINREIEVKNLDKSENAVHTLSKIAPYNPITLDYVEGMDKDRINEIYGLSSSMISMSTINYLINDFYYALGGLGIPQRARQKTLNTAIVKYIKDLDIPNNKLSEVKTVLDRLVCF